MLCRLLFVVCCLSFGAACCLLFMVLMPVGCCVVPVMVVDWLSVLFARWCYSLLLVEVCCNFWCCGGLLLRVVLFVAVSCFFVVLLFVICRPMFAVCSCVLLVV